MRSMMASAKPSAKARSTTRRRTTKTPGTGRGNEAAMLLAQTYLASPPIEIAAWLACLAFVISVINDGFKLAGNFKGKPEAGEVQRESAEKFARREQLESHMRDTHENLDRKSTR